MRETGAESMRELPTLTLFKINMNLEMEKGTEALAAAVEAAPPRELEPQPYDERRHRRDPAPCRGRWTRSSAPTTRPRPSSGSTTEELLERLRGDGRPQDPAPRRRDPLPPPRRLLGQRDGRLEGARGRDHGGRRPHGLLPRHLPLLPAADLRGLALQRLHHGPRPLEGGVRRGPRLDRRGVRDGPRRPRHPLLLDRVQEDPPPLLHRRLRRAGRRSIPSRRALRRSCTSGRCRSFPAGSTRRSGRCGRSAATRSSSSAARAASWSTSTATATSTGSAPGAR